jgi:selenocysteine-specific elongation factor
MKVIGTAGHVDHGKSTLVKALTGIDPDRLKEEKAREMTIDLGFAWLTLPDGEVVGIIDVPGHKDFVENMLAGVGAIDAVMLVVDANEGFMPQTREHLAIIDQLHINHGVILLTKCDMINDPEWLDLLVSDIREDVKGTCLSDVSIVNVSAKTGEGLPELINCLASELRQIPNARDIGRPRLSVDRVFSIQGFGTVVTGTLLDGRLHIGDEIYLSNGEKHGRIRGLQTHNQKVAEALPGSRVAINISGLDVNEIKRGDLLQNEIQQGSFRIDAWIKLLDTISRPLKHNDLIKVFHLASEHTGRVRLLGKDELSPGEDGFVQIEMADPLFAEVGDRFILRIPSPSETIGGGKILQLHVSKKYRRYSSDIILRLSVLHNGSLEEKILETVKDSVTFSRQSLEKVIGYSEKEISDKFNEMMASGQIITLCEENGDLKPVTYMTGIQFSTISQQIIRRLDEFHTAKPLRTGMTIEELKHSINLDRGVLDALIDRLVTVHIITVTNGQFRLNDFKVILTRGQEKSIEKINQKIDLTPFSPPEISDLLKDVDQDIFDYLLSAGEITRVNKDIVFRKTEFEKMLTFVNTTIRKNGKLTVSEFRDAFGNSRKYALAFLEYMDATGVTLREADYRILKLPNIKQA